MEPHWIGVKWLLVKALGLVVGLMKGFVLTPLALDRWFIDAKPEARLPFSFLTRKPLVLEILSWYSNRWKVQCKAALVAAFRNCQRVARHISGTQPTCRCEVSIAMEFLPHSYTTVTSPVSVLGPLRQQEDT